MKCKFFRSHISRGFIEVAQGLGDGNGGDYTCLFKSYFALSA